MKASFLITPRIIERSSRVYLRLKVTADGYVTPVRTSYELHKIQQIKTAYPTLFDILRTVSILSHISIERLKEKTREREIVEKRQFYFKRARDHTKCSLAQIGRLVGKDHATVLHGIKAVNNTYGMIKDYEKFFDKN